MNTLELLKAARALIRDPKCWTVGAFARAADGGRVQAGDARAVSWCLAGALYHLGLFASEDRPGEAKKALVNALPGGGTTLAEFNDSHTHPEVLAVYDAAIARLESAQEGSYTGE